jgi:hypothetical protein
MRHSNSNHFPDGTAYTTGTLSLRDQTTVTDKVIE